jgi:hypothetical protein
MQPIQKRGKSLVNAIITRGEVIALAKDGSIACHHHVPHGKELQLIYGSIEPSQGLWTHGGSM